MTNMKELMLKTNKQELTSALEELADQLKRYQSDVDSSSLISFGHVNIEEIGKRFMDVIQKSSEWDKSVAVYLATRNSQ